jgi:hypothetical protein
MNPEPVRSGVSRSGNRTRVRQFFALGITSRHKPQPAARRAAKRQTNHRDLQRNPTLRGCDFLNVAQSLRDWDFEQIRFQVIFECLTNQDRSESQSRSD